MPEISRSIELGEGNSVTNPGEKKMKQEKGGDKKPYKTRWKFDVGGGGWGAVRGAKGTKRFGSFRRHVRTRGAESKSTLSEETSEMRET